MLPLFSEYVIKALIDSVPVPVFHEWVPYSVELQNLKIKLC